VTTVVVLVVVLVLLGSYVTWTAGRLDRQHARVDASWAALDAQLVRRASAARALVPHLPGPDAARLEAAAHAAVEASGEDGREGVENDLTRVLRTALPHVPPGEALDELLAAATRVGLARSFHNSAVKDARTLRFRRLVRLLRLSGHRRLPTFFEIDDTGLT
jgi:hypothetical protein